MGAAARRRTLTTVDGRGPYRAEKLSEIAAASVKAVVGGRLPIDENHSIDVAAPKGGPSPARGWITDSPPAPTASGGRSSGPLPASSSSPTAPTASSRRSSATSRTAR